MQAVEAVLNAADQEIVKLNEIDGRQNLILIDHREGRSTLPGYLQGLGFQTQLTQLPCGDVRLSERVLIERKTARDLLESLKTGRLLHQCRSLKVSAQRPLLLVETGGEGAYSVHPNAVLGALAHITLDLGLPVMMVKGPLEAAHFIGVAAQREHDAIERLHAFVSSDVLEGNSLREAMSVAQREISSLVERPDEQHPWLDDRLQHLKRCYQHTLGPLYDSEPELKPAFDAYAPDLGRLFATNAREMMALSGCTEAVAKRAMAALHAGIKTR